MGNDRDKGTVNLSNSDNEEYRKKIAQAKGTNVPLGGAPPPQIPRLDSPPQTDRYAGVQAQRSAAAAQTILTPEQQRALQAEGVPLLPGVGSGYAVNQPALRGQPPPGAVPVEPQQQGVVPRPPGSGLRQETLDQLAAVAQANNNPSKEKEDVDKELAKTAEEIDDLADGWVTDEFGNRIRNLLNNKERREAIEKRCEPMNIADLLMNGEVRQEVPVIPGRFVPVFRSTQGHEDLFVKRKMTQVRGSEQLVMDTFSVYLLTLSLWGINKKPFPSHLDVKTGNVDDELFEAKFKIITRMATTVLADLSVNMNWFNRRVQKLLVLEDIKGF